MEELRTKQRKAFYGKVTAYLSKKFKSLLKNKEWTQTEISRRYKIPTNRLNETIYHRQYSHNPISEKLFLTLIMEGFVTIEELKEDCDLTEEEQDYLNETFAIHKDKRMKRLYIKAQKAGLDPADILEEALAKIE